ncbi:transcriptional regulator [Marinitoga sp. 1135]|uniref:Probable transcriptional regulatory protein Marpi_1634 n=1 Tax=Marinitoga piezophila (strain DSM 14283 / JCM 11233 / KA3) TaxID=443254 RepID=H2J506_MARPK|nr:MULTISPECIES: YebC/PmpR family DNA-binding transcriptional regulator [Marinitoga]AEX86023.1 DNA-binding regulatory protein, YebC/PmpR family [Marinitoga piezophila KA3]APT76447.1 transcriptional regulator [Marinitoga sp. 1137]NUU96209.1 transcriptional regulator [Marinitoga sp. 1135]NUU98132.1 transcriptional regulator [Marinitoga sp. 1138]
MSGHNKWANIKHRKAAQDAKRSKIFTKLIRELTVAAKEGGDDPEANPRLRTAIEKAKDANMPKDKIEAAIKKGAGGTDADSYVEIMYEGYGPAGVAIIMRALTDNKNRTAQEVRHILSKNGGSLAESGAVAWNFERKAMITVPKEEVADLDEFMMEALDAGAEDVIEDETIQVIAAPEDMVQVRDTLKDKGFTVKASLTYIPKNTVKIAGSDAEKMLKLIDALEDSDDIQEVFANFEIDDEEMERLAQKM